ncbi:MAG: FtsQ-type POTRA domain-containing protein [Ignavibacteriales bacterium]|nr:FtsQ-type POTRA domain-containing protein [Ignavibacteriales bacterium]
MSAKLKYGFLALLLGLIALVVSANLWKSSLKVKRFTIEGNRIVEANEISQLINVKRGVQIHDVDLMTVRKDILTHHFIKEVSVERDLPGTLKIVVTERVPLAIVNSGDMLYLDQDGVVLPHSISKELFDLPVLSGFGQSNELKPGTTIRNADVQEALKIFAASKFVSNELYHLISEIRLRDGGDIMLYAAENGVPIIFGRGEIASKLVRLEAFWNDIVREKGSQSLQYIDLRFDEQVVVKWNDKVLSSWKPVTKADIGPLQIRKQ